MPCGTCRGKACLFPGDPCAAPVPCSLNVERGRFAMNKSAGLVVPFVLFSSFTARAADPAIVAVASEGTAPSFPLGAVAARCPYFLLFHETGTSVEARANPHKGAGAGAQAARSVVVAGSLGQKMVGALKAKGIRHLELAASAADAVQRAPAQ